METLKTSETLIEGFVTSKQDGTGSPVEERFPGVLKSFDLGEKRCAEPVSAPVAANGCIDSGNARGIEPVSVSHTVSPAMGVSNRVDLGSREDVPIKGISLFVELTGGVTSDDPPHLQEHVSLGNKVDRESMCDVNGESLHKSEGEVIVGHQECQVNVGDFVWAITKNQSWWPGVICDASSAPKEAAKVQKREGGLLVRCFGNGNYVWCLPFQLKPFVGYFEQLSKQSNSKSFVGALEKAVAELGRRVKTEFTCSCFSKTVMGRRGDIGDLSAARFEPAAFVEYIKDLAREISMPSKIDYTINQNCLSAFYRSLGHCQIPMHQLKSSNNAKAELSPGILSKIKTEEENGLFSEDTNRANNKDTSFMRGDGEKSSSEKSEKPYETRERRKSRFLSYPYTNINAGPKGSPVSGEHDADESKTNFNGVDLNKINGQPVKKPRKKWSRKSIAKHVVPGKGVEASVCSSEMVSELQCAALDCLFPSESKRFYLVEGFISRFRKWAFKDFTSEITFERTVGQEFGFEMRAHQIFAEAGVQSEKAMGMGKAIDVNSTSMAGKGTQGQPVLGTLPKKRRKKNDKLVSSPMTANNTNHGTVIIDFQKVGSLALEAQPLANKSTEVVADQGLQSIEGMGSVSNLNGKYTVLNFGDLPLTEPPSCKSVPKRRKNAKNNTTMNAWNSNGSAWPNVNGHTGPFLVQAIPQKNDGEGLNQATAFHLTKGVGSAPQCCTGNNGEPQVSVIPAGVNLEPKKRGRKRKNMDFEANAGSTIIPDLNGDGAERKKGRRVKKKEETGVPCIDLSYNKVQQDNGEVTGTAFLLKFSPDHPLPSTEDLNSVFCKYGAMNKSETQVMNENLSGQVVFLDSSSAGEAFWGLQNDHPFGHALVNYRVQNLSGGESTGGFKTPIKISSGLKPLQQGGSMDSQAVPGSTMIPDLNGNATENKVLKRSKRKEGVQLSSMDLAHSKQQDNGEVTGTALLLKFSPDHPLPSNEDLNSLFCKYGALNEFETRVLSQNLSGQVVFVNPSSAGEAVQSLAKDRPFGQALVSYQVQHLSSVQAAIQFKTPIKIPLGLKPPQQGEAPDLAIIRKNLELMKSMLEKSGNTLSPEMRAKLEGEIKGLMNKVTTMDGSSSFSI